MRLTVVLCYCKITKNMNDLGLGLKATLTHRFLETCDKFGNNTAIIDDTGSLTYAELGAAAKRLAALLTPPLNPPLAMPCRHDVAKGGIKGGSQNIGIL